ncbi:protein Spindly-B-like isoform X1 [Eriocheir sinensis]|uniref:protein Spindly-B-like isoform X1 n=1 Tax=Eriocheir sinensis TaxID=95602 RepID=UPI0021C9E5C4|nr:protein Spindly-B-like isoform X1 [Eriocheir sinensis]
MEAEVSQLRQQLAEAEHNTVLAATFGKQLLEEKDKLEEKLEALEQEKHCLSLKLEASVKMEQSLVAEVEQLREQQSCQLEVLTRTTQAAQTQKLEKHFKKILDLESIVGSQRLELAESHKKAELLEAQVKEAQERLESFNNLDQSVDDSTSILQAQVTTLTQEKQELEMLASSLRNKLNSDKYRLEQAERKVMDLETALEEKECQFTSYYNALEKNKEEMMELKMEIESLKLAETDPGRKGNSLFAEVEDQRQAMERQLVNYKTNYNILKKQHDFKVQQVAKLKLQVASLLSLSNNRASWEYVSHLEESLASARSQLETFTKRCQELEEAQQTMAIPACVEGSDEVDHSANQLFKNLYTESQKKISDLKQSLHQAEFDKVVLSDRILQLQRKLRQMEAARDASHGEVIRLRVKLDDLTTKKGTDSAKEMKRRVEKIPGFEEHQTASSTAETDSTMSRESVPLKEKLIDPTTMQEVEKQAENTETEASSEGEKHENEENLPPAKLEVKKKPKKTVQLTEVVMVHEIDGQVQETKIKQEDGVKKVERKQKVLKKMECPVTKVSNINSGEESAECKTQ